MEMPIYEYQCEKCGAVEEALQKFSDKPLTKCTHCSGKLHKLISQSAFHLKGSGWYVTDYAGKKQSKKDTTVEKTEKTDSAAAQSTTSDSKASKSNTD
jgi:putative FmdB family regulatory protein